MSIIIRLQNLPWDASALNIRQFFYGLGIPDGGVHIIGGEKGDAFIAFSTDEDARQAMKNDGGYIGSTPVKLFLSSKAEMQSVIAAARENSAPAVPGPSISQGPDLNQSHRMRFINPAHGSDQRPSFGQQSYGHPPPGQNVPRMGFMQIQQQHFNRPMSNDYRPQGHEFRSPTGISNDFRAYAPNPSPTQFQTFEHRSTMPETRMPRMNFDPRQAFHEQTPQPYWGGGQIPRQNDANARLYEPFGNCSEKPGFSYKKQEPVEGRAPMPPSDTHERHDDWNGTGRGSPRDFSGDLRQNDSYHLAGPGNGDFNHRTSGPFERRDVEEDYRRSRMSDRFGPTGDRDMSNPPVGYGRGFGDDDRRRDDAPKFGIDRFSPKRGFAPDFYMDRERPDFHDFKGFCVYVRDLPAYFGPRDIRALFRNCDIPMSRLNIVHDRSGKKVGQAYIRLSCPEELEAALAENGRMVENHRIRVTRCHEKDFEEAGLMEARPRSRHRSRSPRQSSESERYYVVIKNLPGASFVKKCLANVKVAHNGGPYMELGRNGGENGIALVELEHKKDLKEMLSRHKVAFGGHLAHVFCIPRHEFKSRIKASKLISPDGESDSSNYTCVEIFGLSWGSNEEKVRKFFSGIQIVPNGLHIFLDDGGKASGVAYVEFETPSECCKAMEKHKQYLDNRYLVLRMISQAEMNNILEKHYRSGGRFLNDSFKGKGAQVDGGTYEETVVYMKNLNTRTRLEDILEFFHGYKVVKDSIQLQYKDDRPTGDGMVKFSSRREAEDAIMQLNGKVMLGKIVELLF